MASAGYSPGISKTRVEVCIGDKGIPVGILIFTSDRKREYSTFAYHEDWINAPATFNVSPDLALTTVHQIKKKGSGSAPAFFLALGDTEPDAWGRRVIARAHARERRHNPDLGPLNELDYLCAVDDFSRVGALRIRNDNGVFTGSGYQDGRKTPPLLDLRRIYLASRAVESNDESIEDLRYLQGRGTSLGGLRPKCTIMDNDGNLAIGKFPSISDQRSVTRGEVLALWLARRAGIRVAESRVVVVDDVPMAVIRRFDRGPDFGRIHYWSAGTMLQAGRDEDRSYTELVSAIARYCVDVTADSRELWRRIAFNLLITNVDDHLCNTGFLHVGNGLLRLSPAFDLNPFPDKLRESKTWLSEDTGPVTSVKTLVDLANRFYLSRDAALSILAEVVNAVGGWKNLAMSPEIGFCRSDVRDFEPAFEHREMEAARTLLAL